MCRRLALLVGVVFLACTAPSGAQNPVLNQIYGNGVHAYFSRDYVKAHEYLSAAVDSGSKDPRTYYYRGLTFLNLGRQEESEMDFEKGAELEAEDANRFYNVPKALERIQGSSRMLLETHRAEARVIAMQKAEEIRAKRYEQMRNDESRVLQNQAQSAPGMPGGASAQPGVLAPDSFGAPMSDVPAVGVPSELPAVKAPAEFPETNPFSTAPPDGFPAGPAAPEPAMPDAPVAPAAPDADPFSAPAAPASGEDPFSAPAAPAPAPAAGGGNVLGAVGSAIGKAITGSGEDTPPAAADGPFGAPAPADMPPAGADNPFGAPAPADTPPAGADNPFGAPAPADAPPAGAANPFGVPAPADAPPAGAANPFGAPAPADAPPAGAANPFGAPAPADAPPAGAANPFGAPAPADAPPAAGNPFVEE